MNSKLLIIASVVLCSGASAGHESEPSNDDLWDISRGVTIVGSSGFYPLSDWRDMFGGRFSVVEATQTLFQDGRPEGFVHFIEWQTLAPVTVKSFHLFAAGDGAIYNHEREADHVTIKAKSRPEGDYDVVLFSSAMTHPYSFADAPSALAIAVDVPSVTAQFFRAEFVQYDGRRGFDGPRVIELDGFPESLPSPDGIPGSWREEFFGADYRSNPQAAASADPDGDGASNYQEFHDGTDPLDAASLRTRPVTVSTYAGTGDRGGRNGARDEATFDHPVSVTMDPQGRLWITEANLGGFDQALPGAHRIRRIDANGAVSTVSGGAPGLMDGPADEALFAGPTSVIFDSKGNGFISDRANHRIRMLAPNGRVLTFAGSERGFADNTGRGARFDVPIGLAVDAQDNLFVADFFNLRIRKISVLGEVTTFAGGTRGSQDGTLQTATFDSPSYVAISRDGTLYVADWANGKIRKITPSGEVNTFVSGLPNVEVVDVDSAGNVYASVGGDHSYQKFSPDGKLQWALRTPEGFRDGPIAEAQFTHYTKTLVLEGGNILMADPLANRIRLITVAPEPFLSISPGSRHFTNQIEIRMETRAENAEIRYTLDGSAPAATSPLFRHPLMLTNLTTVQAQVFVNEFPVSGIVRETFTRVYAFNDGISEPWRRQYFGPEFRTDPRAAATADPDQDGVINLHEFVSGTDPLDFASSLRVGVHHVPVITWTSVTNKAYRVLRRDWVYSTNSVAITPFIRAVGPVSSHIDFEAPNPHGFYLIEVQP